MRAPSTLQGGSTLPSPSAGGPTPATVGAVVASRSGSRPLRLIADQRYFGLDARMLRAGLERSLARLSAHGEAAPPLADASLAEDFRLDGSGGAALARLLVAGRLLQPEGGAGYRPTPLFHEYARATVVAPLSRERARILIDKVCELARNINARWDRNPFVVRMVAVSGSYMSRRRQLPELRVWLVLRKRPAMSARRWKRPLASREALRQIVDAVNEQSSFIVVRIVADKRAVERPFTIVFEGGDRFAVEPVHPWERFREWGASISRRLGAK
jgi:hypothetical protein